MMPKVTVLTTVYNGLPYLKEAIESTINQTYSSFEYLIIDDASSDKKVIDLIQTYVDRDSRIKFIVNEENLGVSETINKAMSMIKTPYVIRLDQDDISLPNRIEEQIKYLDNNPSISIVCSWETTINSKGKRLRDWKRTINNYGEFLGPVLIGICPIWHPSIAFRTNIFFEAGGFNGKYIRAEDFEFTARLALKRYEAAIVPEILIHQRKNDESQTAIFNQEMINMKNKIHFEGVNYFIGKEEARKLSNFLRLEEDKIDFKFSKEHILNMYSLLIKMFGSVKEKQDLNLNELASLKKTIFRRIGLGVYLIPYYKYLPSILFLPIFFILSPSFSKKIHWVASKIYNLSYEIKYIFK